MCTRQHKEGFTIVELCIAAGIMAVVFLFIMGGIIDVNDSNQVITQRTIAQSQLQSVLEQMRALTIDELAVYTSPAMQGLGAQSTVALSCVDASSAVVTIPLASASSASSLPNPLEVRATVTWRDPQGRLLSHQTATMFRR